MPSWKKVVLHGSSGSLAHLKLENLTSQSVLGTDSQGNVVAGSVSGYSLPTATSSVLGGVKVGNTLTISSQVLNARTYVGATAAVIGGGDGLDGTAGYVPAASASDATLFLRGDGTWQTPTNTITRLRQSGGTLAAGDFTFAGSGATTVSYSGGTFTISSTDTNTTYSVGDGGLTEKNFTTALKNKLDGIAASADNYGGWIISDSVRSETIGSGNTLEVRGSGATSVSYDTTSNTLTISSTDTDTNTTYSAGTGLTLSGTTFSVTANTYAAYSHNHDSVYLKIADTGSIIDYIVAAAPGTLDTLNEIAAAIGDDANFSASIASVIAGKADASHTHSNATTSVAGFMSAADKTKLDGVEASANNYSLPLATSSVRGGVKIGYTANGKNYPVQLSSEQMYVNVPWTDTDTDTVTRVGVPSDVSSGDIEIRGSGATTVTKSGNTITISSTDTDTNTTYSAGTGLTLSGTTFSVTAGTYAAASHTHAISDVTGLQTALDGKAASSHTHDDRYYTETESDARFVLNDFAAQTAATSEDEKSGTWNESSNDSSWGNYKPGNDSTAGYSWNDAPGYVQYNIPSGYTTAYIGQLRWDTGGYFDVHAVMSDGSLVFRGRFLSKNTIENTSHSGNHDGQQIIKVSGLDGMQALRITNQSGRLHLQGIGWSKEVDTDGTQTSETHWDLIYNKPSSFTPSSHTHSDATTGAAGFMSAADKTKLDGIAANANNYSLPTATASVLGGIKVGTNLSISNGVLSSTDTDTVTSVGVPGDLSTGNIELRGSDATTVTKSGGTITISSTDTNTTYSAGTGLTLSGTTFSVTAGTYAAASHTHAISDVTGLQTALDAKQAAGSYLTSESDTLATVTGRGATTGTLITLTKSDVALKAQENGTGTAWRGRIGTFNSSADKSAFLGNYNSRAGVFGHNNALTAWDDLWVNTLGASGQGNLYLSWNTYVKGSSNDTNYAIIHAGNIGDQSVNYASSAGAVAWTNVSGRPTAVSSFTNDAGYLTTYTDTNTVTSVGVSGDLSTGDVELRGSGATTVTKSGGTITISSTDNNTTYSAGTGLTLSGTTFSVTSGTYAAASHTHAISDVTGLQTALDGKAASSHTHDDRYYTETESNQYFGAFGRSTLHGAYSDFNTSPGFGGWSYVIGTTNSGHNGSQGGYRLRVGLGSDYSIDTTSGAYAMELNIPRTGQGGSSTGYLIMRQMENGSWGSWSKISSGYADSAGAVAWTNVSGRPTNVSSFTNDAGYLTTYTDTNTVTSVGVSGDLSTGNITLVGSGATSISKSSGTITISSTDTNTTYSAGTGLTLSGTTFSVTAGTYAAASHTHDDRYYTESEVDSLLTGKVSTDTVKVLGGGISYDTDRSLKVSNGLAIYGAYNGGANTPFTYDIAAQFAFSSRAFELAADWINSDGAKLKLRTLRDCCQNWSPWVSILTSYDFTDWAQQKENQRLSTSNSVTFTATTSPTFLVNDHSDNTKGYRIHNTSGTSVSAMFTNSSNQLVIAAGAVDQINLNKKVLVNGVALGVNVTPSATAGRIDASNDIVAYSSSDRRLKKNITPIEDAVKKVKALTGVEFDWDPEHKAAHGYEGHDTGVIAQQVQEVMPTAVRTNETGYLAVRYEKLIGLLVEANKELAARVEELEKKLG
jgi:hypothetical protein